MNFTHGTIGCHFSVGCVSTVLRALDLSEIKTATKQLAGSSFP